VTRGVTVLYEDQAQGDIKHYGPHELVMQCVCDRLRVDRWKLKTLRGVPRNGNGNLYKDCTREPPKLGRDGGFVVAVYDFDRVREMKQLSLHAMACKSETRDALLKKCPWRDRLVVVFLDRNIETVIEAICDCDPGLSTPEQRTRALVKKDLNARDIILGAASAPTPAGLALRNRVFERVPSFGYLVDKLVAILAAHEREALRVAEDGAEEPPEMA